MAPPNQRNPASNQSPLPDPREHNRALQAKRMAEAATAKSEAELQSKKNLQEMQPPTLNQSPDFPPGFNMPPPPNVGEGNFKQARYSNMPQQPPVVELSADDILAQREAEDAEMARIQAERDTQVDTDRDTVRAPVRPQPKSNVKPKKEAATHPILQQLRLDLGLDTQKSIDLTIGDHVWSFYPLSPEMTTLAMRIADLGSQENTERALLQQYAAVCCSIVAIDNVPLWQVFSIEPEKDDDISHPLVPKGRIRQRAALALLQEVMTNAKLGVMQRLLEAYNDKIDPQGAVKGYTDYQTEKYYRFACPVPDCDFHIVRAKRYDETNRELVYYCERHGEALNDSPLTNLKEGLSPLG